MIQTIRILALASVIVCEAIGAAAQTQSEQELVRGKTIERVAIAADTSQSYALYLPASYDPAKKYPIIYCFDPGGRGAVAVEKYRVAAEKYGYIVAASNNSRNGLDLKLLGSVINNLSDDTNRRFSIDPGRVLSAGMSGGARVASLFAGSCKGCIFGVIGSSAGFIPGINVTAELPFIFFGTAGYDDFNYSELRDLEKKLATAHIAHRFEVFEGGHEWLPESLSDEALAWFELRAMKAGRRAKDERFIDEQYQARVQRAENYLAAKKHYEAYSAFAGIVDDFAGWMDVAVIAEKVKSLESSAEVKRAIKSDADQAAEQLRTTSEIMALRANLADAELRVDARSQLNVKIDSLHKDADGVVDSSKRRTARRTLNQMFIEILEARNLNAGREVNLSLALEDLEIAGRLNPRSPQVPYNRARIFATKGDKKKALEALTKAVELGFKDAKRLANEKAFEVLQKDEGFIKLLAGLKQ